MQSTCNMTEILDTEFLIILVKCSVKVELQHILHDILFLPSSFSMFE